MKLTRITSNTTAQPAEVFQFSKQDPTVIKKFIKPVKNLVIPEFVTGIARMAFSKNTPIREVESIKIEAPSLHGIDDLLYYVSDDVDVEVPDDFASMSELYRAFSPKRRASMVQMLRDDLGFVIASGQLVDYVGSGGNVTIPELRDEHRRFRFRVLHRTHERNYP